MDGAENCGPETQQRQEVTQSLFSSSSNTPHLTEPLLGQNLDRSSWHTVRTFWSSRITWVSLELEWSWSEPCSLDPSWSDPLSWTFLRTWTRSVFKPSFGFLFCYLKNWSSLVLLVLPVEQTGSVLVLMKPEEQIKTWIKVTWVFQNNGLFQEKTVKLKCFRTK